MGDVLVLSDEQNDVLAYKAERRVNAIRELAEMIAGGGNPVELAVQCVEALEDMGWADD
jgi:hypothetical protein